MRKTEEFLYSGEITVGDQGNPNEKQGSSVSHFLMRVGSRTRVEVLRRRIYHHLKGRRVPEDE